MAQIKQVTVRVKQIMHRAEFSRGYYQVLADEPFVEIESDVREQWTYERGRHFGAYMKSIGITDLRIKKNHSVQLDAQFHYKAAKRCGAVI